MARVEIRNYDTIVEEKMIKSRKESKKYITRSKRVGNAKPTSLESG
jgi:hypothetical protein